jgi:hypothetical protein
MPVPADLHQYRRNHRERVTTGLTSGTFYVCQDDTIKIKYSSAPSWVWYPSSF